MSSVEKAIKKNGTKVFWNLIKENRKKTIQNIKDGIYKKSDVRDVTKMFYEFLVQKEIGLGKEEARKIALYACGADKI